LCRIVLISAHSHLSEKNWEEEEENECDNDTHDGVSDIFDRFLDHIVFTIRENELKNGTKERINRSCENDDDHDG